MNFRNQSAALGAPLCCAFQSQPSHAASSASSLQLASRACLCSARHTTEAGHYRACLCFTCPKILIYPRARASAAGLEGAQATEVISSGCSGSTGCCWLFATGQRCLTEGRRFQWLVQHGCTGDLLGHMGSPPGAVAGHDGEDAAESALALAEPVPEPLSGLTDCGFVRGATGVVTLRRFTLDRVPAAASFSLPLPKFSTSRSGCSCSASSFACCKTSGLRTITVYSSSSILIPSKSVSAVRLKPTPTRNLSSAANSL